MRYLLLVCALSLAASGRSAALDLGENQVLVEATIVSITEHEAMQLGLAPFEPSEQIDAFTETQLESSAGLAAAQTQSVITAIQADTSLAASPVGLAALDHLQLARMEQTHLQVLLDAVGFPKAKDALAPVIAGLNFQVAAVNALQGRPDRFSEGNRLVREAGEFWSAYTGVLPWLQIHGLPTDRSALFEPFSPGKSKTLAEAIGLIPGPDVRLGFRKGKFELSALSKEPVTSGADFGFRLSDDFTVLITFSLPEQGGDKPRDELAGFSAGLKVTTDASGNPAEAFFIEHQTTPEGWGQSFTSTKTSILDVFPHGTPSLTRQITSFLVKDEDEIVIGSVLKDGSSETLIQSSVPVLGEVPVLGLFFRNGTKKTRLEADNLIIFVTPHLVSEP